MFTQIIAVVTPIFLITAIGYLWARRGQPFDNATVSGLVMYVGTPALVFHSLTSLRPELAELRQVGLASVGVIAFCLALGYVGLRIARLSSNAFLPTLFQANAGNMGVPLVTLTFGDAGLHLVWLCFLSTRCRKIRWGWAYRPAPCIRLPCCASLSSGLWCWLALCW